VTCTQLSLPSYERPLCPPPGVVKPKGGSLSQGFALGMTSPLRTYRPPNGETIHQVLNDFVKRAVLQQPLPVARTVAGSLGRPFLSWTRNHKPGELPAARWQFQTAFPLYFTHESLALFRHYDGHRPVANRPLARMLRGYQLYLGYTPGPVLLACAVLALVAGLGVGRARHSGQQLACLLWLSTGVGLLLAAALYEFSWRYTLPALVTIPPAAALALSALTSPKTAPEPSAAHQPGGLDNPGSAVRDDGAASHDRAQVEPADGMAGTNESAEPAPAQHHTPSGNPPGQGGQPAMPELAPDGSSPPP